MEARRRVFDEDPAGDGRAARLATTLSVQLGSELHVAYVAPMPDPTAWPEAMVLDYEAIGQMRERAEKDGREVLDAEAKKLGAMGAKVSVSHARTGRPEVEIVRLAEELDAGLIVLGNRGLGEVRRALMGSVSDSVVRHAHCPVLVVREAKDRDVQGGPTAEERVEVRVPNLKG